MIAGGLDITVDCGRIMSLEVKNVFRYHFMHTLCKSRISLRAPTSDGQLVVGLRCLQEHRGGNGCKCCSLMDGPLANKWEKCSLMDRY